MARAARVAWWAMTRQCVDALHAVRRQPACGVSDRRRTLSQGHVGTRRSCQGHRADTTKRNVHVYLGPGTTDRCHLDLLTSLILSLHPRRYTVTAIDAKQIINGQWQQDCAAIAFGGGHTSGFVNALGSTGAQRIREFVQDGGTYIGVCAGAYFACDLVVFRQGGNRDIYARRPLKFFPGTCLGPVRGHWFPALYTSSSRLPVTFRVRALQSNSDGCDDSTVPDVITVTADVDGGGVFLPDCGLDSVGRDVAAFDVLARFTTMAQTSAAVVRCHVGLGTALLSSPHLELAALHTSQGGAVTYDDVMRAACWRWVLQQGKLMTCVTTQPATPPQPRVDSPAVDVVEFG